MFLNLDRHTRLERRAKRQSANVANGLNNFFNGGGTLTPNFVPIFGLSGGNLTAALSQLSGEVATDSQQGAFQLMNQFLGLMVDPFANGRGGGAGGGASDRLCAGTDIELAARHRARLCLGAQGAACNDANRSALERLGSGLWRLQHRERQSGTWHERYDGAGTYGFASGIDYRVTPDTVVGFALAGGGTNWGLAQGLGSGRSDAFQAGVYGTTCPDRPISPPRSPLPVTR